MSLYQPGQRWISENESELGLAIVEEVGARTVRLLFPAVDETRVYAIDNAPLSRVEFTAGDTIRNRENQPLQVTAVQQQQGVLIYTATTAEGGEIQLSEIELDDRLQLNRPQDRLLNARFDAHKNYVLRYETLQQQHRLALSPVRGLLGPRVSLVPHQFYIAHEVAHRPAPRVLLADEVGLGKTIEAGLILHQQLISGRAQRALIIVPDALLHQWLVEMLRRFNLRFSLLDEKRCEALQEQHDNPFHAEQLVLCSLEFFSKQPPRRAQVMAGEWDLLIVDEAHHLGWSEQQPSDEYQLVEQLATSTPGLLLLTATPEQLGAASHFARLRLLDPHRFHDLQAFLREESQYIALAHATEPLLEYRLPDAQQASQLQAFLDEEGQQLLQQLAAQDNEQRRHSCQQLIAQLVDRHGTGRVLFRNTRNTIHGFPQRELLACPLDESNEYRQLVELLLSDSALCQQLSEQLRLPLSRILLTPELLVHALGELGLEDALPAQRWTAFDPRVEWLYQQLKALRDKKVLVICANRHTVLELENYLRTRHGLHAAVFHEQMRIVERDRAAAWFADMDNGSPILICSEIGSEGRNFQFAHHLVLFDLPLNPDLLEQRIGRLDRIGQTETISIHVPYIKNSPAELMFRWYAEALNAFAATCPAGQAMYQRFSEQLHGLIESTDYSANAVNELINTATPIYRQLNQEMQQGRDRLLEINAFRKPLADEILSQLAELEDATDLMDYLQRACDSYGVDSQEHSEHSLILKPGDHMLVDHFPELPDDGVVVTDHRPTALVHEDRQFLSWESPMLVNLMDMLLHGEHGNVTLSIIKSKKFPAGTLLLESLFVAQCIAPKALQADRFLPPTLIRYVMDRQGNDYAEQIPFEKLNTLPAELDKNTLTQIVGMHRKQLKAILLQKQQLAEQALPALSHQALHRMHTQLDGQIARLRDLQQRNPSVRDEEIALLEEEKNQLTGYLQNPQLKLDALRLVMTA